MHKITMFDLENVHPKVVLASSTGNKGRKELLGLLHSTSGRFSYQITFNDKVDYSTTRIGRAIAAYNRIDEGY